MIGVDGETSRGSWEFLRIEEPNCFEVLDSFVDDEGAPIDRLPSMRMTFNFAADGDDTILTNVTWFTSLEALEQVVAMGAVEGATLAMNQLDAVLLGLRAYAQGKGTRTELLDDTHVRITRLINGPATLVWRAHTEADLMRRWMLGPDGWRMTVCEIDPTAGGQYRLWWVNDAEEGPGFGFDGHAILVDPPRRMVSTEHMTGTDFPSTTNDLSVVEEDGATLITLIITYPDIQTRDMVLDTGMTDGMEASYRRMEGVLANP